MNRLDKQINCELNTIDKLKDPSIGIEISPLYLITPLSSPTDHFEGWKHTRAVAC